MNASPNSMSDRLDDRTALHTAARRYCEERYSEWAEAYNKLGAKENVRIEKKFELGWDYSEEAYSIFPRYRLDKGIRIEVERLVPQSSRNLEELRSYLIRACDIAEARLHTELDNTIARKALREECDDFRAYIRVLSKTDLASIAPLPFRRVLTEEESEKLWDQLKEAWAIGEGCWFPLRESPTPLNVLAFHVDYFEKMKGSELLHETFKRRGVSRVFELNELGLDEPDCEIELSILRPAYLWGSEQYCTGETVDWVVYASHESSITIAGEWLTEIFKGKWPDWAQRSYGGPFSTEDLRGTWR